MESSAEETEALYETVVFLSYFKDLPDARQIGKVKYPLGEILLLCLLAVVAGAETITDIARFGRLKLALLQRFLAFEDGTPAHDHLGDILATLDTEAFERCFVAWVAAQTGVPAGVICRGRQNRAPVRFEDLQEEERPQRCDPHRVGFRRASTSRSRSGQGGGEVQRDRRHSQTLAHAGDRGGDRDDRRDGLPARHRADDPRQESRLHPRPEGQSGHAQRRCQALRRRAEGYRFQGCQSQS